jgi:hypothetical protein
MLKVSFGIINAGNDMLNVLRDMLNISLDMVNGKGIHGNGKCPHDMIILSGHAERFH